MSKKPASLRNLELGQAAQQKFNFYFVGLIFTVLALSVQTARFGISPVADSLEIVSWALLLISGIAGLLRLESIPEIYRLYGLQEGQEERIRGAREAQARGAIEFTVAGTNAVVSAGQYIADAQQLAATVGTKLQPQIRWGTIKYRTMKFGFGLGLLVLVTARAYVPVEHILHSFH